MNTETRAVDPDEVRKEALRRLKKRQDFHAHALVYFLVNASTVVIWALTTPHGFFWPAFLMIFWGIGLVMNAWDVYRAGRFTERQVRSEIERLQQPRG